MKKITALEESLENIYKNFPKLPLKIKSFIFKYISWVSLLAAIANLYFAWKLWQWAHSVNNLVNYVNSVNQLYGQTPVLLQRMSLGIWVGLIIIVTESLLYLWAIRPLLRKKKNGWNLLFYISLINILYGIVISFSQFGNVFSLFEYLLISIIELYLLFQIREFYIEKKVKKYKSRKKKKNTN